MSYAMSLLSRMELALCSLRTARYACLSMLLANLKMQLLRFEVQPDKFLILIFQASSRKFPSVTVARIF